MQTEFKDTDTPLALVLRQTLENIKGETITLRELLELVGEQGLLLFCSLLTLPFLLPVSVPGVSTLFGLIIILIGIGVTLHRVPWLPGRLMNRSIMRAHLVPVLEKGAETFERLERWVKPRLKNLTSGVLMNRVNGLVLTSAGVLLLFPLSFIPFSNTLPALSVLFLTFGMIQRDGYFIAAGYVWLGISAAYFGGLALLVIIGGNTLLL
ncbi:MAG: exopolysaccharide biosynthesis protein [Candidatus Loosdrechtia sp.]|uniref:exopolysaccharide biosynthesis protein n=1 Tax=Candidatus Loosdrechtia sp. TaxID=3101272 RepID=UPI00403B2B24